MPLDVQALVQLTALPKDWYSDERLSVSERRERVRRAAKQGPCGCVHEQASQHTLLCHTLALTHEPDGIVRTGSLRYLYLEGETKGVAPGFKRTVRAVRLRRQVAADAQGRGQEGHWPYRRVWREDLPPFSSLGLHTAAGCCLLPRRYFELLYCPGNHTKCILLQMTPRFELHFAAFFKPTILLVGSTSTGSPQV